jgi:hypothetical protein
VTLRGMRRAAVSIEVVCVIRVKKKQGTKSGPPGSAVPARIDPLWLEVVTSLRNHDAEEALTSSIDARQNAGRPITWP